MVCCLGAPQSFLVADSIPFLVQDQGTPHFLRHGGGHCQLPTLCNTCTHVGMCTGSTCRHMGHTTCTETLKRNTQIWGHRTYIDT